MPQSSDGLTSADIKQWFTLWDAVHRIGYDLYGFAKESTWERVNTLVQSIGLAGVCAANSEEGLSYHRQQVQKLAREQLYFSAQHFAFLLDSLYFNQWYQLDPDNQQITTNELTKLRALSRIAAIGENVDMQENLLQFALRRAINQIGDDILLLHQIWDLYGENQPRVIRNALHTGNQWAMSAWQTLRDFLPDTASPLTYIRTMAGTRMIPYGSRALISFPLSALACELKRDYLAIPHELGHYLFWRGKDANGKLFFKQVAELFGDTEQAWMLPWAEEIFADVVGTLVGGPLTVLSLQNMMLEKVGDLFVRDDGHYPLPAIRPSIGLKVCERMGWENSCKGLGERWQAFLESRLTSNWAAQCVSTRSPNNGDKLQTINALYSTLSEFTETLLGLFDLEDFKPHSWTSDTDYATDDAQFYNSFDEKSPVIDPFTEPTPETKPAPETRSWIEIVAESLYQQDPGLAQIFVGTGKEGNWWSEILTMAENETGTDTILLKEPLSISLREWFAILYLGGWGDAGPTGGSPHEVK